MYDPGARRKSRIKLEANQGTPDDFISRYKRDVRTALRTSPKQRQEILAKLPYVAAEPRSLNVAAEYLRQYGGSAPGPDGLTWQQLSVSERWELCHHVSNALNAGEYRPQKTRKVRIDKGGNRCFRTIQIANLVDRMVARSVAQTLQPWCEERFLDVSFGYRPQLGQLHALAAALDVAESEGRWIWLCNDLQDAFDNVPRQRLLDIVATFAPTNLVELISMLIAGKGHCGLPQGSPLSPLLLNVYLDHFLDRTWSKGRKPHLIRFADDLLVLCKKTEIAVRAHDELTKLLIPAGLRLKFEREKSIVDLRQAEAEWLGFRISLGDAGPKILIRDAAWDSLRRNLVLAHGDPEASLRCEQVIRGWIGQLGPCYAHEARPSVLAQIKLIATECGFDELTTSRLRGMWREAWLRWRPLRHNR